MDKEELKSIIWLTLTANIIAVAICFMKMDNIGVFNTMSWAIVSAVALKNFNKLFSKSSD